MRCSVKYVVSDRHNTELAMPVMQPMLPESIPRIVVSVHAPLEKPLSKTSCMRVSYLVNITLHDVLLRGFSSGA